MCRKQIPGTEYCDLTYNYSIRNMSMQVVYYPVLQVEYEYKGTVYKLYINGNDCRCKYATSYPTDNNIRLKQQNMQVIRDKAKTNKTLFGILGFIVCPLAIALAMFIYLVATSVGDMKEFATSFLLWTIVAEIFSLIMRKKAKNTFDQMSINIDVYLKQLDEIKRNIASITMDNNIEESVKNARVQQMLNKTLM